MDVREKAAFVVQKLDEYYPFDGACFLSYKEPHELLFATVLSAQCTDERVNAVTRTLFAKYPCLEAFASADLGEMEKDIFSVGFYHNKARNIIVSAQMILSNFGGHLPSSVEELTKLPGVGRKTANIVRGYIFGLPGIAVDTHVKRVCQKLGLIEFSDPKKIEFRLMEILPKNDWIKFNKQIIAHGRAVCDAKKPRCAACFLCGVCKSCLVGGL